MADGMNILMRGKELGSVLLLAGAVLLASGCTDSDFGEVAGRVTVDGSPVPEGMKISFNAETPGKRAATAVTRPDGTYEVWYTRNQQGAPVGKNLVRLYIDPIDSSAELRKIKIPPEFGVNSTFEVEVKPGSQVIDIALAAN